jgi:hypothetical protein
MIRDLALGLPQPAAAFGSAACCGELKEAHEKPPSQQAGPETRHPAAAVLRLTISFCPRPCPTGWQHGEVRELAAGRTEDVLEREAPVTWKCLDQLTLQSWIYDP